MRSGELNKAWVGMNPDMYIITCGISPRVGEDGKQMYHAVVSQANGYGFKMVHDPHPDDTGLAAPPYAAIWVVPLNKLENAST